MCVNHVTEEQFNELIAAIDRRDQQLAADMPTEQDALKVMFSAWERLKQLGWREAIYCPKDGTPFEVIEAGSTGIHTAHYEGAWPKGSWWVREAGDLWPSRPILYRPLPAQQAPTSASAERSDAAQVAGESSREDH